MSHTPVPEIAVGPIFREWDGQTGDVGLDIYVPNYKRVNIISGILWEEAGGATGATARIDGTTTSMTGAAGSVVGLTLSTATLRFSMQQFSGTEGGTSTTVVPGLHRLSFEVAASDQASAYFTKPMMWAMVLGNAAGGSPGGAVAWSASPSIQPGELFILSCWAFGASSVSMGGSLRPLLNRSPMSNGQGAIEIAYAVSQGGQSIINPTAPGALGYAIPYIRVPYIAP